MEISKATVQQLLRPTDTCTYVAHGNQLDIHSGNERILSIIRHENSKEHALFIFSLDSLGSLLVNKILPIHGSFNALLQSSSAGSCSISINSAQGEVLMFRLPYDTNTATLFSHVKLALDIYTASASINSPSSFNWLRGYEDCRTGWDRFCKPHSNTVSGDEYNAGLPDNWPWGYIITPNPDGGTEVASETKVCESLIEFDPLRANEVPRPPKQSNKSISRPRPISRQLLPKSKNSLLIPETIRGSNSESNIAKLTANSSPSTTPIHSTKSQAALSKKRMGFIEISPTHSDGATPQSTPIHQSSLKPESLVELDSSGSVDNPFLDIPGHAHTDETESSKFWINSGDSDFEMQKIDETSDHNSGGVSRGVSSMGKRTASLDVLNERDTTQEKGTTSRVVLDYNYRRMRTITSAQSVLTQSFDHADVKSSQSFDEVSQTPPPSLQRGRNKTATVQTSKAVSKSPKLFRRKASPRGGANSSSNNKSSWVTRYQPGVLLLKGSMRECLVQRLLREREAEFCEFMNLRLFCGTWNVNGQMPIQRVDKWLLDNKETPHIFAIGFQELDLSTEALLTKESNREEMWMDLVELSLKLAGKFKKICFVRLVGILLIVYVEESLVPYVTDVESDFVPCGIMGHLGNKGGVAIRFNIHHSSICIINSHLAAHQEEIEKRNQDYHQIYNRLQFFKNSQLPYNITDHNIVLWMGDLNYRLQCPLTMSTETVKAHADSFQLHKLLPLDQLHMQQKQGLAFTQFHEGKIDFKPTYKYDPSTNTWDTSEKNRVPAWCDRIMYFSQEDLLSVEKYTSHPEMIISDHKPVSCLFSAMMKLVIPDKEKEILEQITRKLDKQENDTLPQVELNSLEFKFDAVKFMVKQRQQLRVHNMGQRPVQVSFRSTPGNEDTISKPWLTIKPDSAIILTGEYVTIDLSVLVDPDIAPLLHCGKEKLEDILVLHLEGGKDFFISVVGNYLQTCFGSTIDTLVHIHNNIREVPTGELLDLSSSWEEYDNHGFQKRESPPPLDIPKELFRLVQHLLENGIKIENLFTDGGLTNEQERIRDILDTGENSIEGSVYSVAASLLLFLRSLAEPVVPRSLHQKCMDGCNNITLCKQLLMRMPAAHRKVFVYMITFLKKLLMFSHENQLDAKLLASIFGEVLLNINRETRLSMSRKSLAHINKKKATFIYQFLVNDLTVDYN